jgi:hypothetical protein
MTPILARIASRLLAETSSGAKRLARLVGLGAFALLMAVVALGFATAGAFLLLLDRYGPVSATFIVAGAYAVLAIVLAAYLALGHRESTSSRSSAAAIKRSVVDELKSQAGNERERVALMAGAQVAQELRPIHLLLLSLLAGFVAGTRLDRR